MHTGKHILDNPIWNGLISGNKVFAQGRDTVKFFPRDVSPFVAFEENTAAGFDTLYELIAFDTPVVAFTVEELKVPDTWSVLQQVPGFQMIYTGSPLPALHHKEIVPLTEKHVPQMLTLTKLTNPGPFAARTIDFGNYEGIFEDSQLVAMAGQRLHPYDYIEISAVCTHPDYTGKGYARALLLRQIQRIIASAGIPFLHVKSDNSRAINVYKNLGFEIRTGVAFIVLEKKG